MKFMKSIFIAVSAVLAFASVRAGKQTDAKMFLSFVIKYDNSHADVSRTLIVPFKLQAVDDLAALIAESSIFNDVKIEHVQVRNPFVPYACNMVFEISEDICCDCSEEACSMKGAILKAVRAVYGESIVIEWDQVCNYGLSHKEVLVSEQKI